MKRWPPVMLILLLLTAGAIVNIAVAWGFILAHDRPRTLTDETSRSLTAIEISEVFTRYRRPEWLNHANDGGTHVRALDFTSVGSAGVLDPPAGNIIHYILRESRHGLPFRSLRSAQRLGLGPEGSGPFPAEYLHSVQIMDRHLPTDILWPGFAINTVFYAGVVWLLFAAPFALRRRRRIQRGFCPKCAYPAGSSPVCTECGAAVRASPQRGASTTAQSNALGHDHNATIEP